MDSTSACGGWTASGIAHNLYRITEVLQAAQAPPSEWVRSAKEHTQLRVPRAFARSSRALRRRVAHLYTAPLMARSSKRSEDVSDVSEPPASIDAILGGLEAVVRELEAGELPLERALERFEEGIRLARRGSQYLDAVEERVEMLLAERDEVVPFREDRGEGRDDDGA